MNQRLSFVLLIISFLALLVNHYLIDWEKLRLREAYQSLEEVVSDQYGDLISWSNGDRGSDTFRKRTICKGRLSEWSDNKPFVSDISNDSLQVVQNELGIFLVQQTTISSCIYVSCHQLIETYSISNKYLKKAKSDFVSDQLLDMSADSGKYNFRDLIYYEIEGMPSRSIDVLVSLMILFVLIQVLK